MNNQTSDNTNMQEQGNDLYETQNQYTTYSGSYITSPIIEENKRGRGFVGALLGALAGGVIWTAIGCLGFISGWIAILIFFLARFGYQKMAGKMDKFGIVISLVLGLFMIFPATYASYAFSVFRELNSGVTSHFTYWEVLADLYIYLDRYELWGDLIGNLALGYVFTGVAAIYMGASALGNKISSKKAAKK